MAEEEWTFDCIPNIIEEVETIEYPSVLEEIERCRKLYSQRQAIKREKAIDIKPLYYEHMRKRELIAKYPIYKFLCIPPKLPRKSDPCQHIGQIILDRDILTKDEHISFLAQPKRTFARYPRPPRCIHQKRYLPNCTTRIDSLANPKAIRVQNNVQDYQHLLSVRQVENLRKTLQKPPIEYTTIENAITFIHEERRLQNEMRNEELRKCVQIKRRLLKMEKENISKIIFALYEVWKDFLINDQFVVDSNELSSLRKVLENKIIQFCGFDTTSTTHVQHLIKTVAQNLAIWIEKFAANCGFKNVRAEQDRVQMKEDCKTMGDQEILLPIDDYIPYQSPSMSDQHETYLDAEEFGEYDYDIN